MARCEGQGRHPTRARKLRGCPREATTEVDGKQLCNPCAREELRASEDVMMHITGESLLDRGLGLIRMGHAGGKAMDVLLKVNEVEQNPKGFTTALRYLKRAAGLPASGEGAALTSWDGMTGRTQAELVEVFETALTMLRLEQTP